jgi:purine-binding chemotaxis protein CheW
MSAEKMKHIPLKNTAGKPENSKDLLTVIIADQLFGIPVLQVQDVLGPQKVTRIPLAPPEVAGALNLRGRIVTTIDVRTRLNMRPDETIDTSKQMSVVVEHENELYSLIIDKVGDVLTLEDKDFENNPPTMDAIWREISAGIYRLEDNLLIILDVPGLLGSVHNSDN